MSSHELPQKPSKSKLIKPENTLKKKVGNGGFDEKVLVKAQNAIENNDVDFKPIALEFTVGIDKVLAAFKSESIDKKEVVDGIMDFVMQLNSHGSLFHYPLITEISRILVDFLEENPVADENIIEIIEGYKKSVIAIASKQIKDSKNSAGKGLCKALSDACQRYNNRLKTKQEKP